MFLAILKGLNHWFALAAFWGYLIAFALAFTMVVVVFPVGALFMLFAAIFTLPVVVGVSMSLAALERAWMRRWLRASRCPECHAEASVHRWVRPDIAFEDESLRGPQDPPCYECGRCGALFSESGEGVPGPLAAA
ncbi:MAG: hypothetical protein KF724_07405 [Phycisphaeraceae bacterium]|nr:hypothetical protein [Phycisphaeraceae bacterium]